MPKRTIDFLAPDTTLRDILMRGFLAVQQDERETKALCLPGPMRSNTETMDLKVKMEFIPPTPGYKFVGEWDVDSQYVKERTLSLLLPLL